MPWSLGAGQLGVCALYARLRASLNSSTESRVFKLPPLTGAA